MAYRELIAPASLRNRRVNDAYEQQYRWQQSGGESLVEPASLVAQEPCTIPAAQTQPLGEFHLLWEICDAAAPAPKPAASATEPAFAPARGFAYQCTEGMLDEDLVPRGTHTLPGDKRADLTRAPIVVPSSPPPFGPGKPAAVSWRRWDRLVGGTGAPGPEWKAWVAANFEDRFRCRCGILNTSTSHANNLGFSKLYHSLCFGGGGQCSFDPNWGFYLHTEIVLPTALLPAEIVTEICETISRGHNDAGRYEEDDGNDVLEHVRTLGLRIQLNILMQRYQSEFVIAPRESDASIRARLEHEPSAWFVSTFTVEVEPVLTYPSWHSWNPKSNMPHYLTGELCYPFGSPFFTYGASSGSYFQATRGHHKTDAMASCMVNAAFPELLTVDGERKPVVSLVLCPTFDTSKGVVNVHANVRVSVPPQ